MIVVWILLALLAAFLAVVLVRAAMFKPKAETHAAPSEAEVDGQHAIDSLQQMVRCKTVSYPDKALEDRAEFEKFKTLLKKRYPNIHKVCTREEIGLTGLL